MLMAAGGLGYGPTNSFGDGWGLGYGPTNSFAGDGWGRGPVVSHVCLEGDGISDGFKPTRHMEAITDEIFDT